MLYVHHSIPYNTPVLRRCTLQVQAQVVSTLVTIHPTRKFRKGAWPHLHSVASPSKLLYFSSLDTQLSVFCSLVPRPQPPQCILLFVLYFLSALVPKKHK